MGRNDVSNGLGIKSIQRGTFTHSSTTNGDINFDTTISAINVDKSFVFTLRSKYFSYGYNVWEVNTFADTRCDAPDLQILDSTTLRARVNNSIEDSGRRYPIVASEVVEYY